MLIEEVKNGDPVYAFRNFTLLKATEEDGEMMVYLEASNEMIDQQGDIVASSALKKAKEYYKKHGVISWDHKHRELNDPSYIIGEPIDVTFSNMDKTLIKGRLYKHNRHAVSVFDNMRSNCTRYGASVGGLIYDEEPLQTGGNKIKTVLWNDTAITDKPVNMITQGSVSTVPYREFMKALSAGNGVDAGEFTGGRALSNESLQGSSRNFTQDDSERLWTNLFDFIQKGEVYDLGSLNESISKMGYDKTIVDGVIKLLMDRIPQLFN